MLAAGDRALELGEVATDHGDVERRQDRLLRLAVEQEREAGAHERLGRSARPEPDEWSVLECLGHVTDSELVVASRYRWIVAQDEPPLVGYDQDLWVDRLHHNEDDPEVLLETFEALRRANLALWARSTGQERARVGLHTERGPESFDLTFNLAAGHDRFHLDQARRALAALG